MGFSVRIAPGVRVRASSRGLRTSLGPRAARIHVGAGRTRLSSSTGPVRFSTTLGTGRGRTTSTRSNAARPSSASASRAPSPAALAKAEQGQALLAAAHALTVIHRVAFAPASAPVAPTPAAPSPAEVAAVRTRHVKEAMVGISIFARRARAQARTRAEHQADQELQAGAEAAAHERREVQARLDELWQALLSGDPDVVLSTLAEAFADNEAPAAPLAVEGDEVSITLLAPPPSIVPDKAPTTTEAGNLSLRKIPARQRAAMHTDAVMAHVLVTLRETFAVAPSLSAARVVVLADAGPDAYGRSRLQATLAGRWTRTALERVAWDEVDAHTIATDTATELIINLRPAGLQPLDLTDQPGITALIESVDTDELTT